MEGEHEYVRSIIDAVRMKHRREREQTHGRSCLYGLATGFQQRSRSFPSRVEQTGVHSTLRYSAHE